VRGDECSDALTEKADVGPRGRLCHQAELTAPNRSATDTARSSSQQGIGRTTSPVRAVPQSATRARIAVDGEVVVP